MLRLLTRPKQRKCGVKSKVHMGRRSSRAPGKAPARPSFPRSSGWRTRYRFRSIEMEAEAYAKAVDCLTKDQNASLALYDFRRQRAQSPAGHPCLLATRHKMCPNCHQTVTCDEFRQLILSFQSSPLPGRGQHGPLEGSRLAAIWTGCEPEPETLAKFTISIATSRRSARCCRCGQITSNG